MSKSITAMRRPSPAKTAVVDPQAAERFLSGGDATAPSPAPQAASAKPIGATAASDKEPTTRTTLDLPKSVHKQIKRHCLENDMSIADYLRGLIERDLT
ncbi:hypothetical protein EDF59_12497 [Novosphingobium sp. ST904]|nr:hypothetical protein EDF59_12497 [Novosphingobium sp. ST904]